MDCSLPGSSLRGILQARIMEWVAISFSRGSSQLMDRSRVSCIAGRRFNFWATREAPIQCLELIISEPDGLSWFFFLDVHKDSLTPSHWRSPEHSFLGLWKCFSPPFAFILSLSSEAGSLWWSYLALPGYSLEQDQRWSFSLTISHSPHLSSGNKHPLSYCKHWGPSSFLPKLSSQLVIVSPVDLSWEVWY